MKVQIRAPAIAFALSAIAVAFIGTPRGETKETSREQLCSTVAWPMIPAACLDGAAQGRNVRMVGPDANAVVAPDANAVGAGAEEQKRQAAMQVRFAADFSSSGLNGARGMND